MQQHLRIVNHLHQHAFQFVDSKLKKSDQKERWVL